MNTGIDRESPEWRERVTQGTRVLQIIVGSLILGVLLFTGFLLWSGAAAQPPRGKLLSFMAAGIATINVILHVSIPMVIQRAALANRSVGSGLSTLLGVYVTRTIIACALLEGAAIFSLVAVQTEHRRWVFAITAGLLVLMFMQFPTRTRIEQWLETRLMEFDVEPR